VTGSAVSTGGRVRLAADLYAVASGERLGRAQVDGPADSVLPLVDRLSVALLRDVWRSHEPVPSLSIASLTTDSLAALRAYLQGERHYRRLAFDSALADYTEAVEVDSTFALAHFRRALIYGWTGGYGSSASQQAAAAGYRVAERLPAPSRRLLAGYRLFDEGSPRAVDSLRAYVADFPNDIEGWFTYGEALHHLRDVAPLEPDSIMAAFDRVITADSTLTPAVIHPLELSLLYRDSLKHQRYLRLFERTASPDHVASHRTAVRMAWGPVPPDSTVARAMASVAYPIITAVASRYRDERSTSASVLELMEVVQRNLGSNPVARNSVTINRGLALVGFGRLRESRALVDSVASTAPGAAVGLLGYPILLGLAPPSSGGPRLRELLQKDLDGLGSPRRNAYAEAVGLMIGGRPAEARRVIAEGIARPDATPDSSRSRGLLEAADGWARMVEGDTAGGIERMRSGLDRANGPRTAEVTAFLRFQLALGLAAGADTRPDGINRLRYGFDSAALFLVPLSYLALGRTYEAAGKPDSAALAYGRFVRLWDKADPELQGRVTEAREALRRLTAEPRR
jgi:tetratricopeptide (TPR) repeat protein